MTQPLITSHHRTPELTRAALKNIREFILGAQWLLEQQKQREPEIHFASGIIKEIYSILNEYTGPYGSAKTLVSHASLCSIMYHIGYWNKNKAYSEFRTYQSAVKIQDNLYIDKNFPAINEVLAHFQRKTMPVTSLTPPIVSSVIPVINADNLQLDKSLFYVMTTLAETDKHYRYIDHKNKGAMTVRTKHDKKNSQKAPKNQTVISDLLNKKMISPTSAIVSQIFKDHTYVNYLLESADSEHGKARIVELLEHVANTGYETFFNTVDLKCIVDDPENSYLPISVIYEATFANRGRSLADNSYWTLSLNDYPETPLSTLITPETWKQ